MMLINWFVVDAFTYTTHYGVVHLGSGDIAWDAIMDPLTGTFFYGIMNHTDHHYSPSHPAGDLRGRGRLRYPVGIFLSVLVAFVPPLWYRMTDPVMDAAVAQAKGGDSATPIARTT